MAPGPIWTPLQTAGGQPPEELPEFGEETPLGRAGQPAELAPAYVFLASPESSYVVGRDAERQRRHAHALTPRPGPTPLAGAVAGPVASPGTGVAAGPAPEYVPSL